MPKVQYTEFSGQLNIGVTDFAKPANELSAMKNCYEYEIGKLEKVPGYSKAVTDQVVNDKSVNYLHYYYRSTTQDKYMIAGSDSGSDYILKYVDDDDTTWNTLASATYTDRAGAEISAVNYLDKAFIVGHDNGTFLDNATVEGTTYSTADSDLTDMPTGKYIVRYRDLLYVLNAYEDSTTRPSRGYFCSTPTDGAITWTPTTDFVEFGYDNGDEITGGVEAFDKLIVFKHYSMWKYDEDERKQIADIGCDSYRSIAKINGVPYWFSRQGIWRWGGSRPQLISNKVKYFIDAIDQSTLGEQIGIQHGDEYRVFIGSVTVKGVAYDNTWLCFDTQKEKWYIRCTYDEVKSACIFEQSDKTRAYFGDDNGWVFKFATKVDEVYSDNSNDIDSFFITNNLDFKVPSIIKYSNHMTVFTNNPQGMIMSVDVDNKDEFNQGRKTILKNNVEELDIMGGGYRYRFKFAEKSSNQSWTFEGFVINTDAKEEEL